MTEFCSLMTVEVEVSLAFLTFNHGMDGLSPLLERLVDSPPCSFTVEFSAPQDADKIMKAQQKAADTTQRQREFSIDLLMCWQRRHTLLMKAALTSVGF